MMHDMVVHVLDSLFYMSSLLGLISGVDDSRCRIRRKLNGCHVRERVRLMMMNLIVDARTGRHSRMLISNLDPQPMFLSYSSHP